MINGVIIIYIYCNITFIASHMLRICPGAIETSVCDNGSEIVKTKNMNLIPILPDHLKRTGFQRLQTSIDLSPPSNLKCPKCSNALHSQKTYADYLLIDSDISKSVSLSEIALSLKINDKSYFLRGVADFKAPCIATGIGHYNSFCRRNDGQWEE